MSGKRVRFAPDADMEDASGADELAAPPIDAATARAARAEARAPPEERWGGAGDEADPSPTDAAAAGVPLEPFHLRAERAALRGGLPSGRPPRERDAWLASLGPEHGAGGGGGEGEESSSSDDDDRAPTPPRPATSLAERDEMRLRLARLLRPRESALNALRRLASPTPPGSRVPRPSRRVPPAAASEFDEITALADRLMAAGDVGVHSAPKERIVAATGAKADAGARAASPSDDGRAGVAALEAAVDARERAAAAEQRRRAGGARAPPLPPHLAGTDYRPAPCPDTGDALLYSTSRGLWAVPGAPGVVRCAATGAWKRARPVTDDGGRSGT